MTMLDAPYREATLPVAERVADLLARMTLEEKVAQLGSIWSFELFRRVATDAITTPDLLRARPTTISGPKDR